ncbi:hypothetical protein CAAN3_15S02982 [[Candida] anglica]
MIDPHSNNSTLSQLKSAAGDHLVLCTGLIAKMNTQECKSIRGWNIQYFSTKCDKLECDMWYILNSLYAHICIRK